MTKKKVTKRRQKALAELKSRERKRRLQIWGAVIVVVAALGGLLWWTNRPNIVESQLPAGEDGMAWGSVDAPVVMEEWSDYN